MTGKLDPDTEEPHHLIYCSNTVLTAPCVQLHSSNLPGLLLDISLHNVTLALVHMHANTHRAQPRDDDAVIMYHLIKTLSLLCLLVFHSSIFDFFCSTSDTMDLHRGPPPPHGRTRPLWSCYVAKLITADWWTSSGQVFHTADHASSHQTAKFEKKKKFQKLSLQTTLNCTHLCQSIMCKCVRGQPFDHNLLVSVSIVT